MLAGLRENGEHEDWLRYRTREWCDRPVQQIYPTQRPIREPADLIEAYAYPETSSAPYVRASMVSTLDGAAWGPDQRSGSISSAADREVFRIMRGLTDVILVGGGTVRAEGYGPAETGGELADHRAAAAGQRPDPVIAVVSRRLDFDPAAPLFAAATERTIVLTTEDSPAARRHELSKIATVIVAGDKSVDFDVGLAALAENGLHRVLCEGGPRMLTDLAHAGRLDELCLTVSPLLVGGSAPRILAGGAAVEYSPLRLAHIIEADGTLLTRWLRQPAPSTSASS